jgi:Fic family protein
MIWNWQQPDWPDFTWETTPLAALEATFLKQSGMLIGSVKHLPLEDRTAFTIDVITGEALKTSEIEGEFLNRASVQSSLRHQFGLEANDRTIPPAERGIAEMMIALYQDFAAPLTEETLFAWHRLIVSERSDLGAVGRYRDHEDAMQVVSGALHKPKVHFEAPPSRAMAHEMGRFLDWFARTRADGPAPLPALTRAGIAHLYFVSIHPFEDGNGRIARAIAQMALSQGIGEPSLIALSHGIQRQRAAYYDALERANKTNHITDWLTYFAQVIVNAQTYSQTLIEFLIAKTQFCGRFGGNLNPRQARAIARLFKEGPDGFKGGLSAANYMTITDASRATTTRDLQELVAKEALVQTGQLKSTRYYLCLPPVTRVAVAASYLRSLTPTERLQNDNVIVG